MNDSLVPEAGEPQTTDSQFLDMVRQTNEQRANKEGEGDAKTQDKEKEEEQEEGQIQEEEGDQQSGGGLDEGDESGILTDPLAATPKKNTKTENLKNMRNSLKAEKERAADLEVQLNEAKTRLESKEIPEEIQEKLTNYEGRLEKLDKYEKLFGLYNTEGYQEVYHESEKTITDKMNSIAADYGVAPEDIQSLLSVTNRKVLMENLQDHFDIHTAGELRNLVLEHQELLKKREEADLNPEKARQELLTIMQERKKEIRKKAFTDLGNAVEVGWTQSLERYADPKVGLEVLRDMPGDKVHQEQREQLLGRAQGELGKFLQAFVHGGLTQMPPQMAQALAARFQLSEVAGILHNENRELQKQVEDLQTANDKLTKYSRPLNNGTSPGGKSGRVPGKEEVPREKIASHVMQKAIQETNK